MLKFEVWFYHTDMCQNDSDGKVNSVETDLGLDDLLSLNTYDHYGMLAIMEEPFLHQWIVYYISRHII